MRPTSEKAKEYYARDNFTLRRLTEARRDAGQQEAQRIHAAASHPDVQQVKFLPEGGVPITQSNSAAKALQFKDSFKKDGSLRDRVYSRTRQSMKEMAVQRRGISQSKVQSHEAYLL